MHNFKTIGFCGAAFPGDKKDTIILNSNRSPKQLNFDCGHEIIHLIKHKEQVDGTFTCFEKKQNSFLEWEANEGSAELLMPYRELLPILKLNKTVNFTSSKIYEFKEALSQKFMAPPATVEIRISNLKYETYQYLNGVDLDNIEILSNKQQKSRGICVESLNDIHKTLQAREEFKIFIQKPITKSNPPLEAII